MRHVMKTRNKPRWREPFDTLRLIGSAGTIETATAERPKLKTALRALKTATWAFRKPPVATSGIPDAQSTIQGDKRLSDSLVMLQARFNNNPIYDHPDVADMRAAELDMISKIEVRNDNRR